MKRGKTRLPIKGKPTNMKDIKPKASISRIATPLLDCDAISKAVMQVVSVNSR